MMGSKVLVKVWREAEQEPDGRADHQGQRIALGDEHQRIPGKSQDALIHLTALGERLQNVRSCSFATF